MKATVFDEARSSIPLRRRVDKKDEIVELDTERPRQRTKISPPETAIVDLTNINSIICDDDYMSDDTLAKAFKHLFPSTKAHAAPQPQPITPKEKTLELEPCLFSFKDKKITAGKAVELASGDFMRVEKLINRLIIRTADDEILYSLNFLVGTIFTRTKYLDYLPRKMNEVVIMERGVHVRLEEVIEIRRLIITNAPFPEYRCEGLLICRWVWGTGGESKYEGKISRVSEMEADKGYRWGEDVLRSLWRREKIEEMRLQKESKDREEWELRLRQRVQFKQRRSYTVDLTKDSFFNEMPKKVAVDQSPGVKIAMSTGITSETPISPQTSKKYYTRNAEVGEGSQGEKPHVPSAPISPDINVSQNILEDISPVFTFEEQDDIPLRRLCAPEITHVRRVKSAPSSPTTTNASISINPSSQICPSLNQNFQNLKYPISLHPNQLPSQTSLHRNQLPSLTNRNIKRRRLKYTFGDAFCGAGGTSCGAELANFRVSWGVDCDIAAISSFKTNFPAASGYHEPIDQFLANIDESILVDVLHLSPPCQPYSPAHTREGRNDEPNQAAMFSIDKLLDACRPRYATVEQTPGILNHQPFFWGLLSQFLDKGYSVIFKVLYGVEYGLPQNRKRLFVIAAGPGETLPAFPKPTHYMNQPDPNLLRPRTVYDAIAHIPPIATDHEPRPFVWPKAQYDPHKFFKYTIMAGGGDYDIHPSGTRPFTLRETACLQSFPMDFAFKGGWGQKKRQVGNAVPPVLGKAILSTIREALEKCDEKRRQRKWEERKNGVIVGEEGAFDDEF